MGFFNKVLIQETKTGNIIDITNLDSKHYEAFISAMDRLSILYKVAIKSKELSNKLQHENK